MPPAQWALLVQGLAGGTDAVLALLAVGTAHVAGRSRRLEHAVVVRVLAIRDAVVVVIRVRPVSDSVVVASGSPSLSS
jgi:hypothetical protein